jgi:hypothetical protein
MMSKRTNGINGLDSNGIGYQRIKWLKLNGTLQKLNEQETILEVILSSPILPHTKVQFEMDFEAQIPLQVDGMTGRDNSLGIRYSLPQCFPKICVYDREGWHADPYVDVGDSYELGDYDVMIRIDKHYVLGATGYLQNPAEIGYGYEKEGTVIKRPPGEKLNWHFLAPNVHDFVWAADPQFRHLVRQIPGGPTIHVFYTQNLIQYEKYFKNQYPRAEDYRSKRDSLWNELLDGMEAVYPFIRDKYGPYTYQQFSFIQGTPVGATSYPMVSLVSSFSFEMDFHEFMHQWYAFMLSVNVSEQAWMAEGFATWAAERVKNYYINDVLKGRIPQSSQLENMVIDTFDQEKYPLQNIHEGRYDGYLYLGATKEEPLTTWADYYESYQAFNIGAYSKGLIFLEQLGYIVGAATRDKIILEFYRQWKFKHPLPNDLIRVAEKVSGMQLGWYEMYWLNTTQTIDYGFDSVWEEKNITQIRLKKIGRMPMPIDLVIQFKDGKKMLEYIPMYLLFGEKPVEDSGISRRVHDPWKPTDSTYTISIAGSIKNICNMEIDPTQRMADMDRRNNVWPFRKNP